MNPYVPFLGLTLAAASVSVNAEAHISLDAPVSRYYLASSSEADQGKLKSGPCGVSGDKRTTNASLITTFKPGETITVSWRETVQHPGHYRIAFDSDGQDFPMPGTTVPSGVTILADNIPDTSGSSYSQTVTLPNIECANCTLQLIQVMTTAAPPYAAGDLYFNCADLVLKAASGSGGAPGTGGTQNRGGSGPTGGTSTPSGGVSFGTGGAAPIGGTLATGGARSTGGSMATGGVNTSTRGGDSSTNTTIAGFSSGGALSDSTTGGVKPLPTGGTRSENFAAGGATTSSATGGESSSQVAGGTSYVNGGALSVGSAVGGASGQPLTQTTSPASSPKDDGGCGCHIERAPRDWGRVSPMLLGMMLLTRRRGSKSLRRVEASGNR